MAVAYVETRDVPFSQLNRFPGNARRGDVEQIRESIRRHGQYRSLVVRDTGSELVILAGNHTHDAIRAEGHKTARCEIITCSDDEARRINLADNRLAELGSYDNDELAELLSYLDGDYEGTGYTDEDVDAILTPPADDAPDTEKSKRNLAEMFGAPPFTIFDAKQGYWQERKQAWIALGLKSEVGRSQDLMDGFKNAAMAKARYDGKDLNGASWENGTSIFDPVLTELLIRWYSAPGHKVLDPFAGGSVRGLVTHRLGRTYTGVDLRAEQVEANDEQGKDWAVRSLLASVEQPRWIVGDSRNIRALIPPDDEYDMMLTCPPYYDLEQYSDNPADLSKAGDYKQFLVDYRDCLAAATDRMKPDAFAAIVTGAVRDKRGYVLDLPSDTTRIMESLGWKLYQDAVLATVPSTASLRAGRQFRALRKLTRIHQMVGVYHRGDINLVRDWPPAEVGETDDDEAGQPA